MKKIALSLMIGLGISIALLSNSTNVNAAPQIPSPLNCATAQKIGVSINECQALVDLYFSTTTQGAGWYNNLNWSTDTSVCSWFGVQCDQNSKIVSLVLNKNGLSGTLPDSLSYLTNLYNLDLSSNNLVGTLPSAWSTLTSIQKLNLSYNKLIGTLPSAWSTWTVMNSLDLSNNSISGYLPASWSTWSSMSMFNFSSNSLQGKIPLSWIETFPSLDEQDNFIVEVSNTCIATFSKDDPQNQQEWFMNYVVQKNSSTKPQDGAGTQPRDGKATPTDGKDSGLGESTSLNCASNLTIDANLVNKVTSFYPGDLIGYNIYFSNNGLYDVSDIQLRVTPSQGMSIDTLLPYVSLKGGFGEPGDVCYDSLIDSTTGLYVDMLNERIFNRTRGVYKNLQEYLEAQQGWSGGSNRGSYLIEGLSMNEMSFSDFVALELGINLSEISECGNPSQQSYILSLGDLLAGDSREILLTGKIAKNNNYLSAQNSISSAFEIRSVNRIHKELDISDNIDVIDVNFSANRPGFAGGSTTSSLSSSKDNTIKGDKKNEDKKDNTTKEDKKNNIDKEDKKNEEQKDNTTQEDKKDNTDKEDKKNEEQKDNTTQGGNKNEEQYNVSCLMDHQDYKISYMSDIPRGGITRDAIITLINNCVIQGKNAEGKEFGTYDKVTYGELYKMTVRYLDLEYNKDNKGHRALAYKITARKFDLLEGTNLDAGLDTVVTKEDVVTILNNVRAYKGLSKTFSPDNIPGLYVLRGKLALLMNSLLQ